MCTASNASFHLLVCKNIVRLPFDRDELQLRNCTHHYTDGYIKVLIEVENQGSLFTSDLLT
jgi:hypothetical protein